MRTALSIVSVCALLACGKPPTSKPISDEYEKPVKELVLPGVLAAGEPFDITVVTANRACPPERVVRFSRDETSYTIVVRAYFVEYLSIALPPCNAFDETNTVRVGALSPGLYHVVGNPDATDGSRIDLSIEVH